MTELNTIINNAKPSLRRPSMWTCVFINDDYTPMVFVTQILIEVFNQSKNDADAIMMRVHQDGKASVGRYPKEIALLKADQAIAVAISYQYPLQVIPTELKG
jgi:ATP-dependent Clp protease adaptor protein ClpS